jgi:hypothetical protein
MACAGVAVRGVIASSLQAVGADIAQPEGEWAGDNQEKGSKAILNRNVAESVVQGEVE